MATPGDVRELALSIPRTAESRDMARQGFRVKDRRFAPLRRDSASQALRVDRDQRREMAEAGPAKFSWTPDYEDYDPMLVLLAAVDDEEPASLLTLAWFYMTPAKLAEQYEASLV